MGERARCSAKAKKVAIQEAKRMKLGKIEKRFMSSPRHAKRVTERAKKLLRFTSLEGKENFLEVGCGNGAASKYIASNYHLNVTGIDLAPEGLFG